MTRPWLARLKAQKNKNTLEEEPTKPTEGVLSASVGSPSSVFQKVAAPGACDERAAIMMIDGNLPEGWAEALAAILCGPRPANVSRDRWIALHDPILRFADQHARQLHELGWTFEELFDAPENWNRIDQRGIGWAIAQGELIHATSQTITLLRDGGRYTHNKPVRANHANLTPL